MHKTNYPLHPIISQIHTTICELTNTITQLITPYFSIKYNIKLTH